jgi:cathepsin D
MRCSNEGCRQHKQYDAEASPTHQHIGYALDVMFGTGELNGEVNQDNVFVGDLEVKLQDFAEIIEETGSVFLNVRIVRK